MMEFLEGALKVWGMILSAILVLVVLVVPVIIITVWAGIWTMVF